MGILEDLAATAARIEAKVDNLGGTSPPPGPVDCLLSAWSPWSEWTLNNDGVTERRKRTRTVVTAPANGGAACGPMEEVETRDATIPEPLPEASFTAAPLAGDAPLTVQFTNTSVHANAWTWRFGDGTPLDHNENPAHTFTQPGTYSVSLEAAGPGGVDATAATAMITVSPVAPPPPPPPPGTEPPLPADTQGWTISLSATPTGASDTVPGIPATSKHTRWVRSEKDGIFRIFGGDYGNEWQSAQSGVPATQSYDPRLKKWALVHVWGQPGDVQPTGNDEVGVAEDTLRDGFWLCGGFQWNTSAGAPGPDVSATRVHNTVMFMDRATGKWSIPFPGLAFPTSGQGPARIVHDRVKDRLIGWIYDRVITLDCKTGVFTNKGMTVPGYNFRPDKSTHFLIGRYYYALDPNAGKLHVGRFNVDTFAAEVVAQMPEPFLGSGSDFAFIEDTREIMVPCAGPAFNIWLVNVDTGAIRKGPPPPLNLLGQPVPVGGCNYSPETKEVILGFSVFSYPETYPAGSKPDYIWHYKIPAEQPPAPPPGEV